jgi:hypothetical protein
MSDAIQETIERGQIQFKAIDECQIVVAQAKSELSVLSRNDPRIAAKPQI